MRPDIMPGGIFLDYKLPDRTNTLRRLLHLLKGSAAQVGPI